MKVLISISAKRIARVMTLVALGFSLASVIGSLSTDVSKEGPLLMEMREGFVQLSTLHGEANILMWYSLSALLCSVFLATIAFAKKGKPLGEKTASAGSASLRNMSPMRLIFDNALKPVYIFLRKSVIGLIEWRYGIRTMGRVELSALGLDADTNRKDYVPTGWTHLYRILRKHEVGPQDVFVDFGSGLGRVVFQATNRYLFQRVVGVELSEQLNEVAKANIERNRHRLHCKDIQLVTSDVLDYEIPDDVSVAYFGNPFTGNIFKTVIQRLLSSVDRNPRRLRVIYYNPVEHDFLLATGRLRLVRRLRGFRPTAEWSRSNSTYMYELIPRP